MKIGFISDLHLDVNQYLTEGELKVEEQIKVIIEELNKRDLDYFLISGDIMNNMETIDVVRRINEEVDTEVYYVLGNHDVWSEKRMTEDIIRKYLEDERCLVNKKVKICDDYTIVGIYSWYDGSLDTLGQDKYFYEKNHKIFGDFIYTHWGKPNFEVCEEKIEDAISILDKVETENIILLNHFVPALDYVEHKPENINWNICNGFMGTEKVMELVRKDKRVKYLTYGHTHKGVGVVKHTDNLTVISNPLGYVYEWEEGTFKDRFKRMLIEIEI